MLKATLSISKGLKGEELKGLSSKRGVVFLPFLAVVTPSPKADYPNHAQDCMQHMLQMNGRNTELGCSNAIFTALTRNDTKSSKQIVSFRYAHTYKDLRVEPVAPTQNADSRGEENVAFRLVGGMDPVTKMLQKHLM